MSRITIIGGHGKVALLAAPLLVAAGHEVRSIIRNPDHADEVAATGASPVVADIEHLDTQALTAHLAGNEVVIWSAGAGGGSPERTKAVDEEAAIRSMDAAAVAGVQHYLMVSYFGASKDHGVDPSDSFYAYAEAKANADEHLRGTELGWTILKPSNLTLDPGTGKIDVEASSGGQVPRADVAAVIAAAVEAGEAVHGKEIAFNTGDEPIAEAIKH